MTIFQDKIMNNIDNTINSIGLKIKYYRNLNNVSLSSLAKEAKISKSTLFGLEEGRSNPTISTLINIAQTLNIKLTELLGENDESGKSRVNFTLICKDEKSSTSIYKLTLLPQEFFEFNEKINSQIELELLNGNLVSLNDSKILDINDSVKLDSKSKIKALSNGATAIVKIKESSENVYIKQDLFYDKPTSSIISSIANVAQTELISRAIFRSIYPIEHPPKKRYTQIIERLSKKEVHYYILSTLIGFTGSVTLALKESNIQANKKLAGLIEFIDKINKEDELLKSDFENIDFNPIEKIEKLTHQAILEANYAQSITAEELINSNFKPSQRVVLIDELIDGKDIVNLKELSVSIKLYRALELMFQFKEQEMTTEELELYTKIREQLPRAFYFAKNQETTLAINTVETLLEELKTEIECSNSMKMYIEILFNLKALIREYDRFINLKTTTLIENYAKDNNFEIIQKSNIHPSIGSSGKFIYIFKKR